LLVEPERAGIDRDSAVPPDPRVACRVPAFAVRGNESPPAL
jgi:hypothetical protein